MSGDVTYSDDEFSRLVALHCPRWEARSTDIVRALLVSSKTVATVANDFGIKPQHARELRKRFLERVTTRKLPAEQFMQNVKPAALPGLELFKVEIGKLARRGYAFEQIADFLRANDVQFTDDELKDFLKGNQQ